MQLLAVTLPVVETAPPREVASEFGPTETEVAVFAVKLQVSKTMVAPEIAPPVAVVVIPMRTIRNDGDRAERG